MEKKVKKEVETCPVRKSVITLGGKWTILIISVLKESKRYGKIRKEIPEISEKMLIQRLRLLEERNIVKRKDFKQIPPKVEYSLTGLGKRVLKIIPILAEIGQEL